MTRIARRVGGAPTKCALVAAGLAAALAGFVPILTATGAARATSGVSDSSEARLQQVVRGLVAAGAPGALVVVRKPTQITRAASGFANLQPSVRMQTRDRYRIASVTKPFVATLVLQLAAQRRLDLDDPLSRWLPRVVPNARAITLRELLNHTSGLYEVDNDRKWVKARIADPGRWWSPRELVAIAASHQPLFPAGTSWSYSNTNYLLLGLVVEAVTGTTLTHQLRDRLTEPLGLRATSLITKSAGERGLAHGYIASQPGLPIAPGKLLDISSILAPAGWEIASNGDDLTAFFAALLNGRLLSPSLLAAMKTVVVGYDYGLGLSVTYTSCGKAFGHDGDSPGYRNVVYATPNGRRVTSIMVNIDATKLPWTTLHAAADAAFCSG